MMVLQGLNKWVMTWMSAIHKYSLSNGYIMLSWTGLSETLVTASAAKSTPILFQVVQSTYKSITIYYIYIYI